jgi:hypothetical protein
MRSIFVLQERLGSRTSIVGLFVEKQTAARVCQERNQETSIHFNGQTVEPFFVEEHNLQDSVLFRPVIAVR